MSFLSKATVYGVRAAAYVATNQTPERFVSIRDVADDLGISFHFLTKILQQLTESGLMTSSRGPHGGVTLARPANRVSVFDIIASIQGAEMFETCILGLEGCGEKTPCPLHNQWAKERVRLKSLFRETMLDDVARRVKARKFRLGDP